MRGTAKSGTGPRPAEHAALVERLLASAEFGRSPRLRELLAYLWDCTLKVPSAPITEHQIGVAIYSWNPDYDSGADPIVRVQVSQLRKKLEHYFATEGRHEPNVVVIPRGSYSPLVQPREATPEEPVLVIAPRPAAAHSRKWLLPAVALSSVAVTALVMLLLLRPAPAARGAATPSLDRLWKAFQNGRSTQVILSDSSHLILEDILGRGIPLHTYHSPNYPAQSLAGIKNPETRRAAENVLRMEMTGSQDALVAAQIAQMSARYSFPVTLISARGFGMPSPSNLVLLGHSKINPWMELFEARMNFRYEYDYARATARLENRHPRAGEAASYSPVWGEHGYCVVCCAPKPMDEGVALLIFGTDVSSLAAGAQFISDENSLREVYRRIGSSAGVSPYFEVLLETKLLGSVAPEFEVVTVRAK